MAGPSLWCKWCRPQVLLLTSSPPLPVGCPHTSSSTPALLSPLSQSEEGDKTVKKSNVAQWTEVKAVFMTNRVKQNISGAPPLVRFPASGPALSAGGDSPLRCNWWSWRTVSSWTRHSLWEMKRLCAASRNQQRGGRGKEALQTRRSYTWDTFTLGPTRTFSTGTPQTKHKAASNYIKMYHTEKSICKWGRLVMFLKTWSAATWLDETVFIATVLANDLADAAPSWTVMITCSSQ